MTWLPLRGIYFWERTGTHSSALDKSSRKESDRERGMVHVAYRGGPRPDTARCYSTTTSFTYALSLPYNRLHISKIRSVPDAVEGESLAFPPTYARP